MGTSETPNAETRPTAIDPLFPSGEAVIDGHRADEADRREVGRQQVRVLAAVGDYLGSRNRRGKRRHAR